MSEAAGAAHPVLPFWFRQRQGTCERLDANTCRLAAPNQQTAYVSVRHAADGSYLAALRLEPEGPEAAVAEPVHGTEEDAWGAAFELYRNHVIV